MRANQTVLARFAGVGAEAIAARAAVIAAGHRVRTHVVAEQQVAEAARLALTGVALALLAVRAMRAQARILDALAGDLVADLSVAHPVPTHMPAVTHLPSFGLQTLPGSQFTFAQ